MTFYEYDEEPDDDGTLDRATVDAIRRGTSNIADVEAAERLVDQVAGMMVAVATGGPRIDDVKAQYAREYKALAAVLKRLGIKNPNSHSDLWTWYGKVDNGSRDRGRLGAASNLRCSALLSGSGRARRGGRRQPGRRRRSR